MKLEDIFHPFPDTDFENHALTLFQYQYEHNEVYRSFCNVLKINPLKITTIEQIPFLPVSFFKSHIVKTGNFEPEIEFWSSGTTSVGTESFPTQHSRHFIKNASFYERAFLNCFEHFYGNSSNYCFLALLPNYLEQKHSSLIYMMNKLISDSNYAESGFYLYNFDELYEKITTLKEKKVKTILFGVSFALLDFAARFTFSAPNLIVFETGGMKGRRPEMVKEELHQILCNAFDVKNIHSEYGMCELLSQAYSHEQNRFATPPWMKIMLRDERDPLHCCKSLSTGAINIIDFANLHSCAFVATEDLGKKAENGMMEVLGRLDVAQIRGCNLMYL